MSKRVWMDDFLDSFLNAQGAMDFVTLRPLSHLGFQPLFSREWCERMLELDKKSRPLPRRDFGAYGPGPSAWRDQLWFTMMDLKTARLEKKERVALANFFNKGILASAKADPYGFTSNIIHSKKEVLGMLHGFPWQSGGVEHSRLLGKLYTAALHLVHALYTDIYTDNGTENYGEYDASGKYGNNHILVIRHFPDLKPLDLWESAQAIPCKSLDIYTVYRNVKFSCDAISCHSVFKGDLLEGLVDYAVKVDGEFVSSLGELEALKDDVMQHSVRQWQELMGLGFEEMKQKGLLMRCYTFKQLFERAGMDWRPTKEMREAVKGKRFKGEKYWSVPKGNQRAFWRKILDPRIDFYPAGA